MRCLLIGGAGFMGQSISRALSKTDVEELLVMDLPEREELVSALPKVRFIPKNYLDLERHDSVFSGVDSVVYLSTDSHPQASMMDLEHDAQNNIIPAVRMMESCRQHGVRSIVFASSGGAIYGDSGGVPRSENDSTAPLSGYGVVKLAIENYLQIYHSQFGLRTYSLRISNAYGPGQLKGTVIGSVANFLRKMVNEEPIEIWGNGSVIRDYIYINDIADAFIHCIVHADELPPGSYNIGSGKGYSLNQVIDLISKITGLSVDVRYKAARAFDVQSIILDTSKITRASCWRAKIGLPEGISRMFAAISSTDK